MLTKDETTLTRQAQAEGIHPNHIYRLSGNDPDFPLPIDKVGTTKIYKTNDFKRYWADRRRAGITRCKD